MENNYIVQPNIFMERRVMIDFNDPNVFHDRIIFVENKVFYVQSEILSVSSEFFHTLFNGDFAEANREIVLGGVSAACFMYFLSVIYPDELTGPAIRTPEVSCELLIELMDISFRFMCPAAYQEANEAIKYEYNLYGLTRLNFVSFVQIVLFHGLEDFKVLIYDALSEPVFARQKKEELIYAPEEVKNFVLDAYMDGQIQTERIPIHHGAFEFGVNPPLAEVVVQPMMNYEVVEVLEEQDMYEGFFY